MSDSLVESVNKIDVRPVIHFGTLDSKKLLFLQAEAAAAERRLRELNLKILAIRVQNEIQAEKLSVVVAQVEDELAESVKFRLGLAKLSRLGREPV